MLKEPYLAGAIVDIRLRGTFCAMLTSLRDSCYFRPGLISAPPPNDENLFPLVGEPGLDFMIWSVSKLPFTRSKLPLFLIMVSLSGMVNPLMLDSFRLL